MLLWKSPLIPKRWLVFTFQYKNFLFPPFFMWAPVFLLTLTYTTLAPLFSLFNLSDLQRLLAFQYRTFISIHISLVRSKRIRPSQTFYVTFRNMLLNPSPSLAKTARERSFVGWPRLLIQYIHSNHPYLEAVSATARTMPWL